MLRLSIFAAAAALLLFSSTGNADLVLDLATSGPTTVTSGSTVNIDLFLRDTDNSHFGPTAGSGSTALGLGTGGGKLIQSAATGATAAVTGVTVGIDFLNAIPQGVGQLQSPALGGVLSIAGFPGAGITSGIAHIATFAATITGGVGDTVTISADTLGLNAAGTSPVVGNALFGVIPPANNLDAALGSFAAPGAGASFGSLTFEVAAVPEPSTLFVGALLACGGAVYAKRRRKSIATDPDC
ncbi:MAG: PEP-CTERM sorting domain-containing protein [Planctomycetaceae bacterium]